MVPRITVILALAALMGCDQRDSSNSQSPDNSLSPSVGEQNNEVAAMGAKGADRNALRPGRWETKQEIRTINKPGMDPQSKRDILGTSSSLDQCLPPEESRQPDANFFAGGDGSECQYTKFAMQDGKLDAVMSCTATPGSITMTLKGTYTPTSYRLTAVASTSAMNTSAVIAGTWLGPCPNPSAQRAQGDPARR